MLCLLNFVLYFISVRLLHCLELRIIWIMGKFVEFLYNNFQNLKPKN